jgi:hypothetical protein
MSERQALKAKKSSSSPATGTPIRNVNVEGDGGNVVVDAFGVAVVGNGLPTKSANKKTSFRGQAEAGSYGAAIAGDNAYATATKGCVVMAGLSGHASVGDSGVARAADRGLADASLGSIAFVDNGWAASDKQGIAVARIGLAETYQNGIAGAHAGPSESGGERGIAIAGAAGIAIAFEEGESWSKPAMVGRWSAFGLYRAKNIA